MKRVVLAASGVIMLAVAAVAVSYYTKDLPRSNPILLALFPDDTAYGPDYREARFRQISAGMTALEVRDLLGEPLTILAFSQGQFVREFAVTGESSLESGLLSIKRGEPQPDEIAYVYSRPGKRFDNYYVRTVVIDETGRVVSKGVEFYSD